MDRRKFLTYVSCSCCGIVLNSCSTTPITERKQLKIIPEAKLNAQAATIYEKIKSNGHYISTLDIEGLILSNGNFGYGGFVLIDQLGDTIAIENISTAGNVFGPISYDSDIRKLEILQNFSIPFNGAIHLVNGWFAGNPKTSCIFPFQISNTTVTINHMYNKNKVFKLTDILGRETKRNINELLLYIYDDGTVEKGIIIE